MEGSGSVQNNTYPDPDPGGRKLYGSYSNGVGSGSTTLCGAENTGIVGKKCMLQVCWYRCILYNKTVVLLSVSPVVAVVAIMASSALGITSQVLVTLKGSSHGNNYFLKSQNKS